MSSANLSEKSLSRLHAVLAGHVERGDMPGVVALISRRDEVHGLTVGAKAVSGDEPMGRDTLFRISSMTKPIAAAATMLLVGEGAFELDDPVDALLPELADRRVLKQTSGSLTDTVPASRPITVRDLLTMRMGFGFIMEPSSNTFPIAKAASDLGVMPGPPLPHIPFSPDEWLRRFATLPLMYQPGEKWTLCNPFLRAGYTTFSCFWTAPRDLSPRAHFRATRHERHRVQRSTRQAREAGELLHGFIATRDVRASRRR